MFNRHYRVPEWPAPANVRACITTRAGGVSQGCYAGNNVALHVGDDPQSVLRNRAQLCADLGLSQAPQWLEQIHGIDLVRAESDGLVRRADGSFSKQPHRVCAVLSADCLPILLCDSLPQACANPEQGRELDPAQCRSSQVAALHCGWRGLAQGIVAAGVNEFKGPPSSLLAYLGPAISQGHFEVGLDVLEAFYQSARSLAQADAIAQAFVPGQRPRHFYADIYALARAELNALGVTQIYGGGECTYSQGERYYSYRRDGITGRMASLIWLSD